MSAPHTPIPWKVVTANDYDSLAIVDSKGNIICDLDLEDYEILDSDRNDEVRANAKFIVKAVNHHDDIVAVLRAIVDWGRDHTSPRDPNSPHRLLVNACEVLERVNKV